MRQTIAQQLTAGALRPDAATDLNQTTDDLAHTIAAGNAGDVTNKIKATRVKLTSLNTERKPTSDAYRALNSALDTRLPRVTASRRPVKAVVRQRRTRGWPCWC